MAAPATPLPKCPNCNSIIPRTRNRCVSCGMEVSRMEEFRLARAAAKKKQAQAAGSSTKKKLVILICCLLLTPVAYYGAYHLAFYLFSGPPPWKSLPSDPQASVERYIKLIGGDKDAHNESHRAAYAMIAAKSKNPGNASEPDRFLQYHHDIYTYFAELTGDPNWHDHVGIAPDPDPKFSDTFVLTIGPEILHISVVDQAPENERAKGEHHFAVTPFREIDPLSDARKRAGAEEARYGVVRSVAGEGAVDNLKAIVAQGGSPNESSMDRKMRLFPRLANPRAPDIDRDIIRLWPSRTDRAVIYKLEQLIKDDRYGETTRQRARQVLDGTLDEETRAAVGVN